MPTFLAPGFLVAAVLASGVITALHLLAWRRPEPTPFPTARFAPSSAVRAVSRALRLSDVALLVVRVIAVLLAGLALARPVLQPHRAGVARVLLLDASRRVGSMDAVRDSSRVHAAGADAVVRVRIDSVARVLPDSVVGERADVRGTLSAGLVAAVQAAHRLSEAHERVELVVVSPFAAESWDAATEAVRRAWPGVVRAVRVRARGVEGGDAGSERAAQGATTDGSARLLRELPPVDDPVGAAFALALDAASPSVRVRRDALSAADSSWAADGGPVVWWPRAGAGDASPATAAASAVLGDGFRSAAGHFTVLPEVPLRGRAILRWGSGAIAATEEPLGSGCLRTVAVGVPEAGDEVLRPGFVRLVGGLAAPCGGGSAALVDDATLASWAEPAPVNGTSEAGSRRVVAGGVAAQTAAPVPAQPRQSVTLERWLLAGVALALLVEWGLRRQHATHAEHDEGSPAASRAAA